MDQKFKIPLHKPYWDKEEEKAAVLALKTDTGVGDLRFSKELSGVVSKLLSVKCVLPTSSGTTALDLACQCLIEPGDEVILPSFTFSSCANAILLSGGKPIFVDIDPQTYNINPQKIEEKINKRTKAIMVVHYAGMAADMKSIQKIAKKYNLFVIEDAAHALGSTYFGQALGTIGNIGCFSLHGTKNISCGEGGLFVTSSNPIAKNAEIIREKGTDRSSFMRGERKKYSWVGIGQSMVLSDILAAIALAQVKKIKKITKMRQDIAKYYLKQLKPLSGQIDLPVVSEGTNPNWHIFAIRVEKSKRDKIITGLRKAGIEASFHFLPLHTSPMGQKLGYKLGDLPITESVAASFIRLPIYPKLTRPQIDYIVEKLKSLI